jgi:FMN reductase
MSQTAPNQVNIVAFSGNAHRPSRSRRLAELIAQRIQAHIDASLTQYDILDASPGLGAALTRAQLTPGPLKVIKAVEEADVLVVCTPVYKGSYTGLFKHFFDFVDMGALVGKPVVISATGGGSRHALVVEHQLRPLFGFFSALTIPTAIYADEGSFENGELVDENILARVEMAASQTAALIAVRNDPPATAGMPAPASEARDERVVNSKS